MKLYRTFALFFDLMFWFLVWVEVTTNRAHFSIIFISYLAAQNANRNDTSLSQSYATRNNKLYVHVPSDLPTSSAPKHGMAVYRANIVVAIIHEISVTHNKRMMTIQMNSPLLFRIITSFCGFGAHFVVLFSHNIFFFLFLRPVIRICYCIFMPN